MFNLRWGAKRVRCEGAVERSKRARTSVPKASHANSQVQAEPINELESLPELRTIFINERGSANKADGPEDHQAAMAMGNSVAAWDRFYDKHYQPRECQAGIEAMKDWRQQLLTKTTARLNMPAEMTGNSNEIESDSEETCSEMSDCSCDESGSDAEMEE